MHAQQKSNIQTIKLNKLERDDLLTISTVKKIEITPNFVFDFDKNDFHISTQNPVLMKIFHIKINSGLSQT